MTIPEESDPEKGSKPVVLSAFNTIGLVGEITEETSNEVIFAMTTLKETIKTVVEDIADDEADKEQECEIEMFISTPGGNADDMFAIYDVMRLVKDECDIKVTVIGGHVGPMHQMLNEVTEFKKIQDQYLNALVKETNMSKIYLNRLLKKKVNVYLTAEEAVELGIADEVF